MTGNRQIFASESSILRRFCAFFEHGEESSFTIVDPSVWPRHVGGTLRSGAVEYGLLAILLQADLHR